ncbi:hypothetical protein [Maritalea sp.]|uniref:hypothetical protein n=1 Tax=Maritalea sp. TaxID=2003361 RepID=UPI003EF57584
MNIKLIVASLLAALIALAITIWVSPETISKQSETNPEQSGESSEFFDPTAAPKEAIQRAWRTGDKSVQLQYTYTGPNSCWQMGNTQSLSVEGDTAQLTFVPQIRDGFCAEVLTPITFDQVFEVPSEIEILIVEVHHQEGGLIERNELWIEPSA